MKKTTKEIRKDKKFWADPMCYPVFATQRWYHDDAYEGTFGQVDFSRDLGCSLCHDDRVCSEDAGSDV